MKVALVTPAPVTGPRFGAEKGFARLYSELAQHCEATLIEVPVNEASWEGVMQSYLDCYDLDLSGFDLVISTKNPTFMVRHPRHVCWLVHQIRAFYDRFEDEFGRAVALDRARLEENRREIWELDTAAFCAARKIFTIGHEVSRRLQRYNGIASEVMYLPMHAAGYFCGGQDYFFLPGRLHRWKRVDLAIRAFRQARTAQKLLIAGTGEDEQRFRNLAEGDSRIEFIGYVSEQEMIELYAHSRGVIFVPKEEDYGYVTFEAMMSHKPVITCHDSGEPSRFIEHQINGLVVDPDARELSKAIEWVAANPLQASQMGECGFDRIPRYTWDQVVNRLLSAGEETSFREATSSSQPVVSPPSVDRSAGSVNRNGIQFSHHKMLVTDNQVLDPPIGGGRVRIYQLYKHLALKGWEITYVGAYDWPGPAYRDQYLFPHFREIVTPLTQVHFKINNWIQKLAGGKTVIDVTIPRLLKYSPRFQRLVDQQAAECSVIAIAHPWVYPYVRPRDGQFLIYDAQNCEYEIKKQILGDTIVGRKLLADVRRIEGQLCRDAALIFACSRDDADRFVELYGIQNEKIVLVPNGVDASEIQVASSQERAAAKRELGIPSNMPLLLFIGSGYLPNAEAAEFLANQISIRFPQCMLLIVGGVKDSCRKLAERQSPNIRWEGVVDEKRKQLIYKAADIALNPMFSGSGTNIKMLDYFAAGLPVVTTLAGARGLDLEKGDALVGEASEFGDHIQLLLMTPELRSAIGARGRRLAETKFLWKNIAETAHAEIRQVMMGECNATSRPA